MAVSRRETTIHRFINRGGCDLLRRHGWSASMERAGIRPGRKSRVATTITAPGRRVEEATMSSPLGRIAIAEKFGGARRIALRDTPPGASVIHHGRGAASRHPQVKGVITAATTIHDRWRFEHVWLDK
ncbi:MAG: hypothetical protein KF889_22215 [Alphaproteobacteria bacterium]|nr:hypothetical protein [Alphaproteobacteria bacterium]MCW5743534.1 hypothetical protein [Alphaproteobacteria bacterium]